MSKVMEIVTATLDKAVAVPSSVVRGHVDSLRRRNPGAEPAAIVRLLEKEYLALSTTTGGAVGAAAAIPAVGTGTAIALTTANVGTYFAASAAFALAVAEVHGIAVEDTERRRALLLTTILGEDGAQVMDEFALLSGGRIASQLLTKLPIGTVKAVNSRLARRMVRNQAGTQGALAVGRVLPFGIGAVVGASGARALARTVVKNAREAFGPPPERWAREIEAVAVEVLEEAPLELEASAPRLED